eukprot:3588589-Rhodomonas_salina.5
MSQRVSPEVRFKLDPSLEHPHLQPNQGSSSASVRVTQMSVGQERTIVVWDPYTGRRIGVMRGHGAAVVGLAFQLSTERLIRFDLATPASVQMSRCRRCCCVLRHVRMSHLAASKVVFNGVGHCVRRREASQADEGDENGAAWTRCRRLSGGTPTQTNSFALSPALKILS